ncbi:uncharacterized protein LOC123696318 [Colias croceus]|uniref:uncharacterized protein LOC123696318 n=1 Tax=Colias crocea TaxID=72248 RepID=UPI001E27BDFB|nr:uncharacterized protein LOC123696318 [Colias croceus]
MRKQTQTCLFFDFTVQYIYDLFLQLPTSTLIYRAPMQPNNAIIMAQAVGRKTMVVPRDTVSRPVAVKAFGDKTAKQTKTRNKSSSKIPKTLRHDLENALVNLCDIWFEEIKPHLIRNNIKLHVHGQAGDGKLPPAAPGCSHLDPESSAAKCELCRLLSSAANSIGSAVSQAAAAPSTSTP